MKTRAQSETVSPIPLSPAFFHILLTVADKPSHGYAIMKAVRERTNGSVKLGPGSLYWAIQRLVEAGLLVESATKASHSDSRRRSYGLTKLGRGVLKHELAILADIVSFATESDLIDRPKPSS